MIAFDYVIRSVDPHNISDLDFSDDMSSYALMFRVAKKKKNQHISCLCYEVEEVNHFCYMDNMTTKCIANVEFWRLAGLPTMLAIGNTLRRGSKNIMVNPWCNYVKNDCDSIGIVNYIQSSYSVMVFHT